MGKKSKPKKKRRRHKKSIKTKPSSSSDESEEFLTSSSSDESEEEIIQNEDGDQGKEGEKIENKDDVEFADAHKDDDQAVDKIEDKDDGKFAEEHEYDDQADAIDKIEDNDDGKFAEAHEDDVAGGNYTQIEVVREESPFQYEVYYFEGDVDEETFYQGKIIFEDGLEREVSFVPYSDIGTVNLIYTQTLMVSDERIVRPWFYTYSNKIGKYLICYDHFETFLSKWIPPWKKEGKSVQGDDHLGDTRVITEIRKLAETIKHIHKCNVSHEGLHKASNYVVAGNKVKIIRIQHSLEGLTEHQRSLIMTSHFKAFGRFLEESFLEPNISWSERDSFLKLFKYTVSYKTFVRLIIGHPFLEKRAEENMQYFSRIWLNFKSGTFRTGLLEHLLQDSSSLYADYIAGKKDGWFKSDMRAEFLKIYNYKIEDPAADKIEDPKGSPEASAAKYCHKNLSDLLRFIRNVYEHHYEYHLSLQTVYAEIRRLWPNLLDRLHEKNVQRRYKVDSFGLP